MRVLVTGGCGFIASNFIRYAYEKYPTLKIWNLDLLTYAGNPDNLTDIETAEQKKPAKERRYFFIHGDIADRPLVEKIFEEYNFETVFNFAAESHVDRSIINSVNFIKTNIQGTHALLDAARSFKTPLLIQISTDEVYGDRKSGSSIETTALKPSNPYSASKAGADFLTHAYIRTYNFPAIIVRGSNNFGPYQYPEKLMPLTITNFLENKKVPIHGSGLHIRSWIYVKDFCSALDALWQRGSHREIYNVAGTEKTNLDIVKHIAVHMDKNMLESVTHIVDRPGQDVRYSVNDEKLRNHTGWQPDHHFELALEKTLEWYLAHQDWWKKIRATSAFTNHLDMQSKGRWF